MRSFPLPGQLVQIKNSHDPVIQDGTYGVIEGIPGSRRSEYFVCFNASSSFKDKTHVSCSGGPCFPIKVVELTDSKKSILWTFWKWRDYPRAGGGKPYGSIVKVWIFDGNVRRKQHNV